MYFTHKNIIYVPKKIVCILCPLFQTEMHVLQTSVFTSYTSSHQTDKGGCPRRIDRIEHGIDVHQDDNLKTEGPLCANEGRGPRGLQALRFHHPAPVARPATSSGEPDRFRQRR